MLRLVHGRRALLYQYDRHAGSLVCVAGAGQSEPSAWIGQVLPIGAGVAGRVFAEGRPTWVPDIRFDPAPADLPAWAVRRIEIDGLRSVAGVPLLIDGNRVGALTVSDTLGRVFTEDDLEVLSLFAEQAAAAIQNARLYVEAQERLRETTALLSVGQVLAGHELRAELTRRVAREVARTFGADMVGVYSLTPAREALVPLAGYGVPKRLMDFFRDQPLVLAKFPLLLPAWRAGRPVWSPDTRNDPRFDPDWVGALPPHSVLFVPAVVQNEPVGGLILVWWRTGREFPVSEIRLVEGVARQVGLALEADAANQALRESERRFRALIENSSDAIALFAPDGRVLHGSPATTRILGWDLSELIGRNVLSLVHPDDRGAVASRLTEVVRRPEAHLDVRARMLHKDGSWRSVDGVFTNLLDDPSVGAIVNNYRDVTEALALEAQLLQAQKMEAVGRLAGGVAHDFNNLLTVISGRALLLRQRAALDSRSLRDVEMIEKTADRAAALTGQLLAFSRRQVLQPRVLDLHAVVVGLAGMVQRLIGEDIELLTIAPEPVGRVKADQGQIEQVVMNLAVNARDAMPDGGRLTIELANADLDPTSARRHVGAPAGAYAMLAISDTGVGMDAETQSHVFEPFFTTKGPGKGTGLGLSTVYGIVKQHDGYISLESQPRRGTTVRVYLPRVVGEPGGEEPVAAATPAGRGRETVLLVEDQDEVRNLAAEILDAQGYSVIAAASPVEALALADERGPSIHLLLTDVVMPGMSGRELAARLSGRWPRIRVLYMSGYTDDAIIHHGVLDEGVAFLPKPFSPAALSWKVREVLDRPEGA